jgi:hypothetical protein
VLPQPDPCPFCGTEMKWRTDKWIHAGQYGCVMVGIGLYSTTQVRLWNTRDGATPTTADSVLFLVPVEPPPPPFLSQTEDWLADFRQYHTHGKPFRP